MIRQLGLRAALATIGVAFACAASASGDEGATPASSAATAAAPVVVSRNQIRSAIHRGVEYLLKAHDKDTHWERQPERNGYRHDGGETGLVVWTLLELGDELDDPRLGADSEPIASAMAWLIKREPKTTYAAAMQSLAIAKLPLNTNVEARKAAEAAKGYLTAAMRPDGGYTYSALVKGQLGPDNANSGVAVEAMAALRDAGIDVPPGYWITVENYWRSHQHKDGGWSYDEAVRRESSGAMTATALASLHLTRSAANAANSASTQRQPAATTRAGIGSEVMTANALTFLAGEFKPATRDYFFVYELLRACGSNGRHTLGKQDIYATTAAELVAAQAKDGSWLAQFAEPTFTGDQALVSTCYALNILGASLEPVAFSKLEYSDSAAKWNGRPGDVDDLTDWFSRSMKRQMRWQVVSATTPAREDLDAPVMVITGSGDPKLDAATMARLEAFISAGGMVLSVGDGVDGDFTDAVAARYATRIFGGRYEMRELPVTHPIFELWAKVGHPPRVLGVSNGVRELWVHVPGDVAAGWQGAKSADRLLLGANAYAYVTGKVTAWPPEEFTADAPVKQAVTVARLKYKGNWDPEPQAWTRFARLATTRFATHLDVQTVDAHDLDAKKIRIAHLTGTSRLVLAADEQAALKAYIDAGGMLIIDAIGGGTEFGASVTDMLGQLLPAAKLEPIPRNDLLYNGAMPGSAKVVEAEYRKYVPVVRAKQVTPRLQGINLGGRWAVVYSEDDLTSGLLGTNTWGIAGYAPRTAEALVRNLVLYSVRSAAGATTGEAPPEK